MCGHWIGYYCRYPDPPAAVRHSGPARRCQLADEAWPLTLTQSLSSKAKSTGFGALDAVKLDAAPPPAPEYYDKQLPPTLRREIARRVRAARDRNEADLTAAANPRQEYKPGQNQDDTTTNPVYSPLARVDSAIRTASEWQQRRRY
jgi:hypothetical protein